MTMFRIPLPVPGRTYYDLLGVGPEATSTEVRRALVEYKKLLQAQNASPEKLAEANALNLADEAAREAYDAARPPLALLRLEPPGGMVFYDRGASLNALRKELEQFFSSRDAEVYYPSDTTRTDFTSDYSYLKLLDAPRRR